jgi:hypothetical protein
MSLNRQPSLFDAVVRPKFEEHRGDWLELARAEAWRLGDKGQVITIDDVRDACPPPDDVDPRVMGAVFTKRHWECVGYQRSRRAVCHSRPVGQFRRKAKSA